jgi:N-acetylmuramoyl-L-alanine amidase
MITVGLVAGHAKSVTDQGCTSVDGRLIESIYTFAICKKAYNLLKRVGQVSPVLIRQGTDDLISFEDRADRAIQAVCDFVISLHVNSYFTDQQQGARGFHWPGSKIGESISNAILRAMPPPLLRSIRSIPTDASRHEDKWLARPRATIVNYPMPAILLEVGFASNPVDLNALLKSSIQFGICTAIFCGVARYAQLMEIA